MKLAGRMCRSTRSIVGTRIRLLAYFWIFLGSFWSMEVAAQEASDSALCDRAARLAAMEMGVPENVMLAITRTETGRKSDGRLSPWPWTVNMEGKGIWFDTRQKARAYAELRFEQGARSFDIGCFQINHRWHGEHFTSIAAMFDPIENARYAAGFLSRLHLETGDWSKAAAAYHSRTPEYATKYETRFNRILAGLSVGGAGEQQAPLSPANPLPSTSAENHFPFLVKGNSHTAPGSLVPLRQASTRPFIQRGG
ncbi:transglycosylase SLT domain-containing protein [Shimia sp. W99]